MNMIGVLNRAKMRAKIARMVIVTLFVYSFGLFHQLVNAQTYRQSLEGWQGPVTKTQSPQGFGHGSPDSIAQRFSIRIADGSGRNGSRKSIAFDLAGVQEQSKVLYGANASMWVLEFPERLIYEFRFDLRITEAGKDSGCGAVYFYAWEVANRVWYESKKIDYYQKDWLLSTVSFYPLAIPTEINRIILVLQPNVGDSAVSFYVDNLQSRVSIFDDWKDLHQMGEGSGVTSVTEPIGIPEQFTLYQNWPNPWNPETTIKYSLPERAFVRLELFDVLGRKILELVEQEQEAGWHIVILNANGLASGTYFYRLSAGKFMQTKKTVLLK